MAVADEYQNPGVENASITRLDSKHSDGDPESVGYEAFRFYLTAVRRPIAVR